MTMPSVTPSHPNRKTAGQVPKTDEIRLQSALGVLEEIRGLDFYVTTKLDGTSATFLRTLEGELVACSRN